MLVQSGEIGELIKIREFRKALSSLCFTHDPLSKLPNLAKFLIAPIITHCSLKNIANPLKDSQYLIYLY